MISARSQERFPSISRQASCAFHAQQGIACTPMDCEYFRVAPARAPIGAHAFDAAEEAAVKRAQETLNRPKPTKSVPTKKKGNKK